MFIITSEQLESELKENNIGAVAKNHNVPLYTIRYWIKKYKIKYIKRKGLNQVNHFFFDEWSHDMAYILGFITADGSINRYKPYLTIELKSTEDYVLKYILSKLNPIGKILYYNHLDKRTNKIYRSCKISIYSRYIINKLIKYSIFPNKTGKHKIDFEIPNDFKWDFVRGFFDGDGSSYIKSNTINATFACMSIDFLYSLKELININGYLNIKGNPPTLVYFHRDCIKIRDLMYQNECFCFTRKKNIFYSLPDKVLNELWTKDQEEIIWKLTNDGLGPKEIKFIEFPNQSYERIHSKVGNLRKRYKNEKTI